MSTESKLLLGSSLLRPWSWHRRVNNYAELGLRASRGEVAVSPHRHGRGIEDHRLDGWMAGWLDGRSLDGRWSVRVAAQQQSRAAQRRRAIICSASRLQRVLLAAQWSSPVMPNLRCFMIKSFLSGACPCRMGVRVQTTPARLLQYGRSTYSSGPYKSPAGAIHGRAA